ncbi:hypothetical protein IAU60_001815 [Kwoniella sp. DSM 27419]
MSASSSRSRSGQSHSLTTTGPTFHDPEYEAWFSGQDPDRVIPPTFNDLHGTPVDQAANQAAIEAGTLGEAESTPGPRFARFVPGKAYEKALARERMLVPLMGGRSKKAQLGSVAESWGPWPQRADSQDGGQYEKGVPEGQVQMKGMFELEEDPPSRSTSPFKEEMAAEIELRRAEAWVRARRGTRYESRAGEGFLAQVQARSRSRAVIGDQGQFASQSNCEEPASREGTWSRNSHPNQQGSAVSSTTKVQDFACHSLRNVATTTNSSCPPHAKHQPIPDPIDPRLSARSGRQAEEYQAWLLRSDQGRRKRNDKHGWLMGNSDQLGL